MQIEDNVVATIDTNGSSNSLRIGGTINASSAGLAKAGAGTLYVHPFSSTSVNIEGGELALMSNAASTATPLITLQPEPLERNPAGPGQQRHDRAQRQCGHDSIVG